MAASSALTSIRFSRSSMHCSRRQHIRLSRSKANTSVIKGKTTTRTMAISSTVNVLNSSTIASRSDKSTSLGGIAAPRCTRSVLFWRTTFWGGVKAEDVNVKCKKKKLAYFKAWRTWGLPDGHLASSLASHSPRPRSNLGVRNWAPSWAPSSLRGRPREDGPGASCRAHRWRGAGGTRPPYLGAGGAFGGAHPN